VEALTVVKPDRNTTGVSNMKRPEDEHKSDPVKIVSILANGLMLAGLIVSMTISVEKSMSFNMNSARIDRLLVIVEEMKSVDAGLLTQITTLKGTTTADIAVLNERITNITNLLNEIKVLVTRR
jgi:hypothetical protein